ncbi:MAG: DNA-binding beta-propeller fold protein YncE, partial [Planctomycetota bacterium]
MSFTRSLGSLIATLAVALPASAQHAQVSSVVGHPTAPNVVWVCNRDNDSVSVIDFSVSPPNVAEVAVGINPRSIAITPDGLKAFVANQRGNVDLNQNFINGFPGPVHRGTVSVIDVPSKTVVATLTDVGVEPYGLAIAPNGKFFAVSGFRSGTVKLFDATTHAPAGTLQYARDLSNVPAGMTIADVDTNADGIADVGEPRGFTIRADSQQIWMTHNRSPYVSTLDVVLDGSGIPTGISFGSKIDTNEYLANTHLNPVRIQVEASQGLPRFLEDVALSPDGTRAVVPHLLHNINHDVTHDFGPNAIHTALNRVYPAITVLDAVSGSYGAPGDTSTRLHHEHTDEATPAEYSAFGPTGDTNAGDKIILGATGSPVLGTPMTFVASGLAPGDVATLHLGSHLANIPVTGGTLLTRPRISRNISSGTASFTVHVSATNLIDLVGYAQIVVDVGGFGTEFMVSNGLKFRLETTGHTAGKMGHRAGHPSRVSYNAAGDHVLMLNRGSEDLFLYSASGSDLTLRATFPERMEFEERNALDSSTPMGDLPLGMAIVPDATTANDDALVYVINEGTRTLSSIRVDFTAGTMHKERSQVLTITSADKFTLSERVGQELFEDASRPQTSGNFNNSCASCHFEGGADGNVWQRPAGPRSTMPVYGGTLGTGLILWKGVRLNMGETGPMFDGENGGHGTLTDAEQQGLTDWHERVAFPLNPNLDPGTGDLTPLAQLGSDLFFGRNTTSLNPSLRHAGCANCHADVETNPNQNPGPRFFTLDFVEPQLSGGEMLGILDPECFSLRENIIAENIRNVNTGSNTDEDDDGFADIDRNLDGFDDRETYAIMNPDADDDFKRDDANGYQCDCTPGSFGCDVDGRRIFTRDMRAFSIPTKLGIFSTGPFFHDHAAYSLRTLIDPEAQSLDPVYGTPAYGGGAT